MEGLKEKILDKTKEGKIFCKDALDLSRELNLSPAEIGRECDALQIKIRGCQLGCFK